MQLSLRKWVVFVEALSVLIVSNVVVLFMFIGIAVG